MTEKEVIPERKYKPAKVILKCNNCDFRIEWKGAPWDMFVGFSTLSELGYIHAMHAHHGISIWSEK